VTAVSSKPASAEGAHRVIEGRGGLAALGGLYADSLGRLRASRRLRLSLLGWSVLGLSVCAGISVPVAALVSPPAAAWAALGSVLWSVVVTLVLVGGGAMLVTPDGRRIDYYGLPNGLTALRAYTCFPLILCAALPLAGNTGLYLWCAIGMPAGALDLVDGWIARRFGPVTELGEALDPLGDAVFFSVGAVGCVLVGIIPAWLGGVMLLRYAGPLLLTPIVFLMRRRPALVHTEWGRRSTLLTGVVLFVCMVVRLAGGPVQVPAILLGIPLLVTTTVLHFATLWRRVAEAPVVRPSRKERRTS
jgi:phosphatidylglycerophosphate synthase